MVFAYSFDLGYCESQRAQLIQLESKLEYVLPVWNALAAVLASILAMNSSMQLLTMVRKL